MDARPRIEPCEKSRPPMVITMNTPVDATIKTYTWLSIKFILFDLTIRISVRYANTATMTIKPTTGITALIFNLSKKPLIKLFSFSCFILFNDVCPDIELTSLNHLGDKIFFAEIRASHNLSINSAILHDYNAVAH